MNIAAIPSPTQSVWHIGPLPLRAYALCIILGIVAACVVTEIRMRRRGAPPSLVLDIAVWGVPAGIIGARIYHVITSPAHYFGEGGEPIRALYIWEGGLGIWGAVAGGAVGAWIACRRLGVPLPFLADCLAPGLPLAQGIGRWGNWFNNELYGGPTDVPWALKIYDFDTSRGEAKLDALGEPDLLGEYHPTFLYESVWDIGVAVLVWQLDKRFKFGRGRAFALYVMAYCVGRFWIEAMRTDEASHFLGMRLNNWTSIVVFVGALIYFLRAKGPRQRLVVAEDGTITAVDPGDPRAAAVTPADSATSSAGSSADRDADRDDAGDAGPDAGRDEPARVGAPDEESAAAADHGSDAPEVPPATTDHTPFRRPQSGGDVADDAEAKP
ncbi:prolipoprotein diacylglyceryl transferase [Virgisporangium aliadipatigenens]|uniref:prolipoprotein diacylglyceryl transferase n=1 Tax=Virgisporangium aliadipatigenens TaxID=741659 RepID=UPI00194355E2|nr:prolipoprotein diacylglyceryl transferase [Virgisporangium aliadipatigenens]